MLPLPAGRGRGVRVVARGPPLISSRITTSSGELSLADNPMAMSRCRFGDNRESTSQTSGRALLDSLFPMTSVERTSSRMNRAWVLGGAVVWGVFASGCSAGAHSLADRTTLLAQATATDCRPGDSTMVCCIKKHPYDPAGACGAIASDIEDAIKAGAKVETALQRGTDEGAGEGAESDDPDEGWREHCRDTYVLCKSQKKPRWVGPCYDCFRLCEGQHQWPFQMCWQKAR